MKALLTLAGYLLAGIIALIAGFVFGAPAWAVFLSFYFASQLFFIRGSVDA